MVFSARRMTVFCIAGLLVSIVVLGSRGTAQTPAAADPAVERARQQVKMLDDIYKTTVVAITDKYVHKETDTAAATVALGLFDAMKKKGWHETRLIDATGHPYNEQNVAKDDFEKAAVKALLGGQAYYEQVVKTDGKQRLRAATPVPVVMKKCVMCHEHFKDVKEGVPIGLLVYDVPVK